MWQHHYVMHMMRMEELRAEAARERRWHLQDLANGRAAKASPPGRARVLAARGIAALSRGAARVARHLDARVIVEPRAGERLLRDG
jgi:hypothetical protein